jgi:hypothetical protein
MAPIADKDAIMQHDKYRCCRVLNLPRHLDIVARRPGVTARVVVDQIGDLRLTRRVAPPLSA